MSGGGWVWGGPLFDGVWAPFCPFSRGDFALRILGIGGGPFMRDICEALDLVWRMGISMRSLLYFAHTEETSGFLKNLAKFP